MKKISMTKLVWHHFIWLPHFVNLRHLYCNLNFILNFFSFVINLIPTVSMIGRWNFEVSLLQLVGIINTHSKHHFGSWCFVDSFLQLVGIFNNHNLYNSWFHFHKLWVFSILKICYHKATKHYLPMKLFVSIGFMKQKTFRNVL